MSIEGGQPHALGRALADGEQQDVFLAEPVPITSSMSLEIIRIATPDLARARMSR